MATASIQIPEGAHRALKDFCKPEGKTLGIVAGKAIEHWLALNRCERVKDSLALLSPTALQKKAA